ncbi:hypothetical protein L7F22_011324 [Adiantum nelumboides]|nr:hypothetical protein [Adiantum nelumboides]
MAVGSSADVPCCTVAAKIPHVVVLPFPAQGHTNPALSIARFLAANGISVTLVHASSSLLPQTNSTPASNGNHDAPAEASPMRHETIPSGFDHSKPLSTETLMASIDAMGSAFNEVLQKLMLEDNAPVCLLLDSFFGWGDAMALEFGLSRVTLWTSTASTLCLGIHVPDLVARGFIPATEEGAKDKTVDFLPGLSAFRIADMPKSLIAVEDLQSDTFTFFTSTFEHAKVADRILVNTMYELETSVIESLRKVDHVDVDPVGPLHMISTASSASVSLIQQDDDCLSWLDLQQQSSVLYIAFGSLASLEENAIAELAHGLEASGESFLWVIRRDTYKNKASVEEILPEGFMQRTINRGLVISWAPQLAVLGHSSVGAFLTHCGWNSVLESLSNGVPMLGFPQMAEQNTNLKLIVDDWKVGLPLLQTQGKAQKIERIATEKAITSLMRGEEGLQIRTQAREWKQIAKNATRGSSRNNLQKLVDDLKTGKLKHPKH